MSTRLGQAKLHVLPQQASDATNSMHNHAQPATPMRLRRCQVGERGGARKCYPLVCCLPCPLGRVNPTVSQDWAP